MDCSSTADATVVGTSTQTHIMVKNNLRQDKESFMLLFLRRANYVVRKLTASIPSIGSQIKLYYSKF